MKSFLALQCFPPKATLDIPTSENEVILDNAMFRKCWRIYINNSLQFLKFFSNLRNQPDVFSVEKETWDEVLWENLRKIPSQLRNPFDTIYFCAPRKEIKTTDQDVFSFGLILWHVKHRGLFNAKLHIY